MRAARRREALPERLAFDQFHDDVRRIIDDTQLEHGDQVGMIEGAGGSRLLLESSSAGRHPAAKDADRILIATCAVEFRVAGAIDLAHAASAKLREDFVGSDPLADEVSAHFLSTFVQFCITVSEFANDPASSPTRNTKNRPFASMSC